MSHFSPGDWVDSIRNLLPLERKTELRSHLDRECPECVSALAFWRTVAEFLSHEERYGPPEHVFRAAELSYAAHKPWRWLISAAQWAELVFDSFRQPAVAFVRGSAPSGRHFIHEAKPFVIDLKLEADATGNKLSLVGQILNSENPDLATRDIDVVLLNGEVLVAQTTANNGGEFALHCESYADLRLFINIRGERAIGVALSDIIET